MLSGLINQIILYHQAQKIRRGEIKQNQKTKNKPDGPGLVFFNLSERIGHGNWRCKKIEDGKEKLEKANVYFPFSIFYFLSKLKLHLRNIFFFGIFQLKEIPFLEIKHPRDYISGKGLYGHIKTVDFIVIILTGESDFILG